MIKKNMNFKSAIFKMFFTYLMVYLLAFMSKYNSDIESLLNNIEHKYLMILNMISMLLGLPLSIVFDSMLMKFFGFHYILFFSPLLTILSLIQVSMLSKSNFKFSSIMFFKQLEKNYFLKLFKNVTFSSSYMLIMSSFPILPHVLGSYIIASSKIKTKVILMNTFLGSFFYYIFLYLMIWNV